MFFSSARVCASTAIMLLTIVGCSKREAVQGSSSSAIADTPEAATIPNELPLPATVAAEMAQPFVDYEVQTYNNGEKRTVIFHGPAGATADSDWYHVAKEGSFAVAVKGYRVDLAEAEQKARSAKAYRFAEMIESAPDRLLWRAINDGEQKPMYFFYVVKQIGKEEYTLSNYDIYWQHVREAPASRAHLDWLLKAVDGFRVKPIAGETVAAIDTQAKPGEFPSDQQYWAQRPNLLPIENIAGFCWSPEGDAVWAYGMSKIFRADLATKALITMRSEFNEAIVAAPDGTWFAVGEDDEGVLAVHQGSDLVKLRETKIAGGIQSLAVDDRGERIAAGLKNGNVVLLKASDLSVLREFPQAHKQLVFWLDFSPDGTQLVSSSNTELRIWKLEDGEAILSLPRDGETEELSFRFPQFSPSGEQLIYSDGRWQRGSVVVLNLESGEIAHEFGRSVDQMAVSPDGKLVAYSADYSLRLCELATGKLLCRWQAVEYCNGIAFSRDGEKLAVSGDDHPDRLCWWLVADLIEHPENVRLHGDEMASVLTDSPLMRSVAFSADGKRLAAAGGVSGNGDLYWLSADPLEILATAADEGSSARFMPDGKLTSGQGGGVRFWNTAGDKLELQRRITGFWEPDYTFIKKGVQFVAHDGSRPDTLLIIDSANRDTLKEMPGAKEKIRKLCVMPDERWAVTATEHAVQLWDLQAGKLEKELLGGDDLDINTIALTSDGKRLAVIGDSQMDVYQFDDMSLVCKLAKRTFRTFPFRAAFTPDGNLLVTSDSSKLDVWRMPSGEQLAELRGHVGMIEDISFSPDSQTMATAAHDGSVKLWRLPVAPP